MQSAVLEKCLSQEHHRRRRSHLACARNIRLALTDYPRIIILGQPRGDP
jgi:hypothetical protein